MEFRPVDDKLADACIHSRFCTDCSCRHGCPIRREFYANSELKFEFFLQLAEIRISKLIPKELAYEVAQDLRRKRNDELRRYKFFEY